MLRTVEERGVRLDPALVHRRARPAQVVRHLPRRARERLRGGHALRRLGHRRVQPRPGERRARHARRRHLRAAAVGPSPTRPSARMFCDITNLDGSPFEGDPRQVLKRNLDRARERGFTFYRRPRDGVLLLRRAVDAARPPVPLDTGSYFDLTTADVASRPAQAHHPHPRGHGHPGRVLVPRGQPQPARDRPALHRRPDHGRQRHDLPAGGARDRHRAGRLRHVHAQAARRRAGLGHAHPPVAVRGRRQRLPRPRRPLRAVQGRAGASSPACCTTPRRSPRSPTSW